MRKAVYARLAVTSVRKNKQFYLPYLLTCSLCVMLYYIIIAIANNGDIGFLDSTVGMVMGMAGGLSLIFAGFFLFYTSGFLNKRRQKEFGVYSILGMEKRHLGRMLVYEALYVAAVSFAGGILGGMLLGELVYMLLLKLMSLPVTAGYLAPSPRAAVETVAENTSDGVTAPMMYIFIGGAPLGYLYKAINTMDSILGYKNERYLNFGRYPAKLDDIANFIPSRLTALLMIAASFLLGFDGRNAIRIFRRDRAKHASPNSAQTESVCAGALRVRLAGDIRYFGKVHKKDYIGDPIREIEAEDIIRSHRLMYGTAALTAMVFFAAYGLLYFNL